MDVIQICNKELMNLCLNKSTSKTRQSTKSAEKECVHVTLYKAQIK